MKEPETYRLLRPKALAMRATKNRLLHCVRNDGGKKQMMARSTDLLIAIGIGIGATVNIWEAFNLRFYK
ncbi:hypothetical protein [Sediminicola sp. 1XM1-17]|uniref:hypothetical protein n=1 Tax=Sediminicola sp. 1XM1-17 TaxID=3127702 RepID=UPI003076D145